MFPTYYSARQNTVFGYYFASDPLWSGVVLDRVQSCDVDQTVMLGRGEVWDLYKQSLQQVSISAPLHLNHGVLSLTIRRKQTEVETQTFLVPDCKTQLDLQTQLSKLVRYEFELQVFVFLFNSFTF